MLDQVLSRHWITLHGFAVVLGLLIYVIGSRARHQRRHPSAAIAWVVSLTLLPYMALPLYLVLGSRKVQHDLATRPLPTAQSLAGEPDTPTGRFGRLAGAMGLPSAAPYQQLAIHEDGQQALAALLSVMQGAAESLDLCTFLLGHDVLGHQVADVLVQQARRGVRVRLLVDGIGVYLGGRPNLKRLSAAGVVVALFVSPLRSALPGRTNLRNHRKMVIADGQRLWTGGRNLAAEYFVGDPRPLHQKEPWVDLSFDLQGAVAGQAQQRFDQDWAFATQQTPPGPCLGTQASTAPHTHVHALGVAHASQAAEAQLIASGPDQADDTIYALLLSSCFSAQSRILAVSPYFVPDATLLMALTLAARRGIAVDLVLPRRSNHSLADLARPGALRDMVAAGARVWLTPEMIHAKAVIFDQELALCGSANLDERSLFLNYELMVAFFDADDVQRFAHWIERQREGAQLYHVHRPGLVRELTEGLVRWVAFQL